jgi:8-amino-7-oxononanoate synthase
MSYKSMKVLEKRLETLREAGLYRSLRRIESASHRIVQIEEKNRLMCASNNYLGLVNDERLINAAIGAVRQYGTGASGSRLTTGNTELHERLERRIAAFKGTEDAILFNTGYMANLAALTALVGEDDLIFSDELNHASIIDGCRLSKANVIVYKHSDTADLEAKIQQTPCDGQRLIVTDGVFSMDGDIAFLPELVQLSEKYNAWLVVDDAHGTGVLGTMGKGTVEHFGLSPDKVDIHIGTLSKALAGEGGYIAGSRSLIEYLRNTARPFIFSTALSPGVVGTVLEALEIVESGAALRTRLQVVSKFVRQQLSQIGFQVLPGETPIIAVILGDSSTALKFSRHLEDLGIFAPAIRPPTVPKGSSRIRLTLMATHSNEDIEQMIHGFATVGREFGVSK